MQDNKDRDTRRDKTGTGGDRGTGTRQGQDMILSMMSI
jgi:hypothetical protein